MPTAILPQRGGGLLDLGFVGGDQQVEAMIPAQLGQFVADAGGRAGHDREGADSDVTTHYLPKVRSPRPRQGLSTTLMQPSCLSRNVL